MRLYIVTIEEPIYLKPFVEAIIRTQVVAGVTILRRPWIRLRGPLGVLREFLTTVGLLTVLYRPSDLLRLVGYSLIDGLALVIPSLCPRHRIATIAREHGIPVYYTNDVNSESLRHHLLAQALDVVIYQIPQIVKGPTLQVPRWGSLNRHSSVLPRYRGSFPIFWGVLRGERQFGVTIHWMNERVDDGAILDQVSFERSDGESVSSMYQRANQLGTELMLRVLDGLKRGEWQDRPNSGEGIETFSRPGLRHIAVYWKKQLSARWSMLWNEA